MSSGIACGPAAAVCAAGASVGYDFTESAVESVVAGESRGLMRLGGSSTTAEENVGLLLKVGTSAVMAGISAGAAGRSTSNSVRCRRSIQVCFSLPPFLSRMPLVIGKQKFGTKVA